jgi:NAD(P)-dependent dehydrogenase (short-subunit alcohol dehydrogenase family)
MTEQIDGCRALVIGASAGIGRAVGMSLSSLGATVAFHGRRADRLDEAVALSGSGFGLVADISEPAGCESVVAGAVERLGGLDLIVHAASSSRLGLLRDIDADEWARVYATNVIAPALVVRAALPHLSEGAVVAVLSSESVGLPYHGLLPYGSSKAALEEVIRGLRLEHPEYRFACIRVGQTIPTDFARDFDPVLAGELLPKWQAIGRMPAKAMEVNELGGLIASILAGTLGAPSVELQDLILRPQGGILLEDVSQSLEQLEAARTAVYGSED